MRTGERWRVKPGTYFFRGSYVSLGYVHYSLAERGVRRKPLLKMSRMEKENKQGCVKEVVFLPQGLRWGTRNNGRVLNRTIGVRCSNSSKIGVFKADRWADARTLWYMHTHPSPPSAFHTHSQDYNWEGEGEQLSAWI